MDWQQFRLQTSKLKRFSSGEFNQQFLINILWQKIKPISNSAKNQIRCNLSFDKALKQTLIRMQFIKFFFSFRYQISRDLKAYTIVLFVVINGFLKRFFFVWNRILALFLLQLITMKRKTMRCRFGMELNRGYKSWRISVWLFNKQKRKQGKSITYLFNAKNICVLLLS